MEIDRCVQAKIGKMLAVAGIVLFVGSSASAISGLPKSEDVAPGLTGVALLMEVAGLGLTEKSRGC